MPAIYCCAVYVLSRRLSLATEKYLRNLETCTSRGRANAAKAYYDYLIHQLGGCDDRELWQLLPPAQANDIKLKICWKGMKHRRFLDPALFDTVSE